eukprot:758381-Hanusia_phi.AAC.5
MAQRAVNDLRDTGQNLQSLFPVLIREPFNVDLLHDKLFAAQSVSIECSLRTRTNQILRLYMLDESSRSHGPLTNIKRLQRRRENFTSPIFLIREYASMTDVQSERSIGIEPVESDCKPRLAQRRSQARQTGFKRIAHPCSILQPRKQNNAGGIRESCSNSSCTTQRHT